MEENLVTGKLFILNFLYVPFIALMHYLKLDAEVMTIFASLLVLDIITGWFKAIAIGDKPKSWRLANGIISKVLFILIPLVMALVAKALHDIDIKVLFYVVVDALILSEAYSILGNIYTIQTGNRVEEFDVLSKILKLIRNTLNKLLQDKDDA